MADSFGLAVNILTVLELGTKFVTLVRDVYTDAQDGLPGITTLTMTSKDLERLARQLEQPGPSATASVPEQTDERIRQLASRCTVVAAKVQATVSGISTQANERNIRKAIMKAFRYKWRQGEIETFKEEIRELRSEVLLNLSVLIRNQVTKSMENEGTILHELADAKTREEALRHKLDHMALQQQAFIQQMVDAFSSIATPSAVFSEDHKQLQASMETDLMSITDNSPQNIRDEDLTRLQVSPQRFDHTRKRFISIFQYENMFQRETGVVEAHDVTLRWIFGRSRSETTWHNFSRWLESDSQIYWITGKMGSGKSTLMKYVSQELPKSRTTSRVRRCTPYLRRWAKEQPLFIATFYFWAGSTQQRNLQTSVQGLYRTLLTQILEAYPEAAARLWPRRWESLWRQDRISTDSELPDDAELERMLNVAVDYVSSKAKICLFIDGLDEFGGSKYDRQSLVDWVKKMTRTLSVKMCVASRPWRVFEDALQQGPHSITCRRPVYVFNKLIEFIETRQTDIAFLLSSMNPNSRWAVF